MQPPDGSHLFMVLCRYSDPEKLELNYLDHVAWVEKYASEGTILLAGGSPDRRSGAILARCASRERLDAMLQGDSFCIAGIVTFEVVEFVGRRGSLAHCFASL
jgi:uncharacterized protein YciI